MPLDVVIIGTTFHTGYFWAEEGQKFADLFSSLFLIFIFKGDPTNPTLKPAFRCHHLHSFFRAKTKNRAEIYSRFESPHRNFLGEEAGE